MTPKWISLEIFVEDDPQAHLDSPPNDISILSLSTILWRGNVGYLNHNVVASQNNFPLDYIGSRQVYAFQMRTLNKSCPPNPSVVWVTSWAKNLLDKKKARYDSDKYWRAGELTNVLWWLPACSCASLDLAVAQVTSTLYSAFKVLKKHTTVKIFFCFRGWVFNAARENRRVRAQWRWLAGVGGSYKVADLDNSFSNCWRREWRWYLWWTITKWTRRNRLDDGYETSSLSSDIITILVIPLAQYHALSDILTDPVVCLNAESNGCKALSVKVIRLGDWCCGSGELSRRSQIKWRKWLCKAL